MLRRVGLTAVAAIGGEREGDNKQVTAPDIAARAAAKVNE